MLNIKLVSWALGLWSAATLIEVGGILSTLSAHSMEKRPANPPNVNKVGGIS